MTINDTRDKLPPMMTNEEISRIPESAYDETVYAVSAGLLWELLGRELTGDEKDQVADCIPHSSIPDALGTIMSEALGLGLDGVDDDEEGQGN